MNATEAATWHAAVERFIRADAAFALQFTDATYTEWVEALGELRQLHQAVELRARVRLASGYSRGRGFK